MPPKAPPSSSRPAQSTTGKSRVPHLLISPRIFPERRHYPNLHLRSDIIYCGRARPRDYTYRDWFNQTNPDYFHPYRRYIATRDAWACRLRHCYLPICHQPNHPKMVF